MEDALKVYARPREWLDSDPQSDGTITNPKWDKPAVPVEQESTDEKALDRWFREQRGSKRVPKRLDLANELLVTNGGPLKMTGNITLIAEDGSVTHANHLSLCRGGASKNNPFVTTSTSKLNFSTMVRYNGFQTGCRSTDRKPSQLPVLRMVR